MGERHPFIDTTLSVSLSAIHHLNPRLGTGQIKPKDDLLWPIRVCMMGVKPSTVERATENRTQGDLLKREIGTFKSSK